MLIRPFELADEDAVVDLWRRCNLTRSWNDPAKDVRRKLRIHGELFLVGVDGGKIVATVMAGYEGHRGAINYLGVDPDCRRHGLGRRIMAEAERLLLERGCPKINLMVRGSNREAIGFYESIGYALDDVVCLSKRLEKDD
jgi:ribosomal protein S18 acetylase RimI-like enzyme